MTRYSRRPGQQVSDEAEALQTDVMRFLAIISMCLMVVFALVQAMPLSQVSNRPSIRTRQMLEDRQLLETKNEHLEKTAAQLRARLRSLEDQISRERRIAAAARARSQADKPPTPAAVPKSKIGFTLGFSSSLALMTLLRITPGVRLYLMAGSKTWKLGFKNSSQVVFLPAPAPSQIYQMAPDTVPDKIIRAGRKVVAAFGRGRSAVTYGVSLPPNMVNKISKLMQHAKGGDLVISSNGNIRIE